jgi:hypothetical protein
MMLPTGRITHQMEGRLRLRIAGKRRDDSYFVRLKETLEKCEGVESVSTNPLAASVLVTGTARAEQVIGFAEHAELFEITDEPMAALLSARVTDQMDRVDARLRGVTRGQLDVSSLAGVALVGAALWQVSRKRVLPEALTVLWYALSILANPVAGPRARRN